MTCPEKCNMYYYKCKPLLWDKSTPSSWSGDVYTSKLDDVAVDGMCYSCHLPLKEFENIRQCSKVELVQQ